MVDERRHFAHVLPRTRRRGGVQLEGIAIDELCAVPMQPAQLASLRVALTERVAADETGRVVRMTEDEEWNIHDRERR